jgi:L-fuconolactonase
MSTSENGRRRGDHGHYVDHVWLAQSKEEVLEPGIPIVDPHHHFWDRRPENSLYLFPEFLEDIRDSGHQIRGTVFVDCTSMYRAQGDRQYACIGEVEFVNGIAAMSASGGYGALRAGAGIVGGVDLMGGAAAGEVLQACIDRAPDRFRGIRQLTAWDAHPDVNLLDFTTPLMLSDRKFREGFAQLAPLGLSFDAFLYHPQMPELIDLVDAFPDTTIIINHFGARAGLGPYAQNRDETFHHWAAHMRELAKRPNVSLKLGGIGMRLAGFGFHDRDEPPTSQQLADAWRPAFETCMEAFGPDRLMFESNYPVDKSLCTYRVVWNTFKRLAASLSAAEKGKLFAGTAIRVYRLPGELALPQGGTPPVSIGLPSVATVKVGSQDW